MHTERSPLPDTVTASGQLLFVITLDRLQHVFHGSYIPMRSRFFY